MPSVLKAVSNEGLETFATALALKVPLKSDLPTKLSDLANDRGFTDNEGTITEITMNGTSLGTSGVVNLGTVITSHQNLKTINGNSLVGTGDLTINGLPSVTSSDNGKILMVSGGSWQLASPVSIFTGTESPNNSLGKDGDIYLQS